MTGFLFKIPTTHQAALAFLVFLTSPAFGQFKGSEILPASFENQNFTRKRISKAPSTALRDLRNSAEALLSSSGLDFTPLGSGEYPIPGWTPPLSAMVSGMPQSGGALPPGLRFPLPPGINYARPPRYSVAQPAWVEAQRLYAEIQKSSIDPSVKQQLQVQWPWLSSRQAELMAELAAIDASWDNIQPKFETALDQYSKEYWRLQDAYREYQRDESAYLTYCGRQLSPGEDLAAAQRECAEMARKLDSRLTDLNSKANQNAAAFREQSARLLGPHNAQISAASARVEHWETRLASFNESAAKALASNQSENSFIDYLQGKYHLDRCQRDFLHRTISRENLSKEEIEEIAAELDRTKNHRCPPRQRE